MNMAPITPSLGFKLSATTSSARVALSEFGQTIILYNAGSVVCFIAFGDVTVTAAVADGTPTVNRTMIPPGAILSFTRSGSYLAYITESSTASIYGFIGQGL